MDYRNSHNGKDKGKTYHNQFVKNPYRSLLWEMEKAILDVVIEKYLIGKAVKHLDFACGTGRILEHLMDRTSLSVGIDVSESMLGIARSYLTSCELVNADITKNDVLEDRKFDLITAFRFFPNAQDKLRLKVMEKLVPHLSQDGYLVFNNHKNYSSIIYSVARLVRKSNCSAMKMDEVNLLVEGFGFNIVNIYHMGVFPSTDKYRLLPRFVLAPIEHFLSKVKALRMLGSNLVFVCKRT